MTTDERLTHIQHMRRDLHHAKALIRNRRADLHLLGTLTLTGYNLQRQALNALDKAGDQVQDALDCLSVLS